MLRPWTTFALVLGLAACGGGEEPKGAGPAPADEGCGCGEEETGGRTYTPAAGTAAIAGVAKYDGEPPARRPLDLAAEPFCVEHHGNTPPLSESVIVGAEGGLANVWVRVADGLAGWKFPKGEGEVVLDQKGCRYVPHLVAAQVGQTLRVRNSDPIMHNVHGINLANKRDIFNWAQAKAGLENTEPLRRPMRIFVKCDVHSWMGAHVMVEKHPFFAVTGEDGTFSLDRLPPGTYTLEAWHEKLGTRTVGVTVADGETAEAVLSFSAR